MYPNHILLLVYLLFSLNRARGAVFSILSKKMNGFGLFILSSHHAVDQLDGQTHISGLQACVEEGLQQEMVVHSLVEVVSLNLGHIPRGRFRLSVDFSRYFVVMVRHFL